MRSARQQASLQVVGNQIFVSGEMRNPRRQATDGVLWVELRRDGQTIDRARYLVEIEAGEKAPFEHRFQLMDLGEGTLSARAVLEY